MSVVTVNLHCPHSVCARRSCPGPQCIQESKCHPEWVTSHSPVLVMHISALRGHKPTFHLSWQLLVLEFGKEKGVLDGETQGYRQVLSELSQMVNHTKYVYFASLSLK